MWNEMRKRAARRKRRIIMNNDGCDCLVPQSPGTTSLRPNDLPSAETFLQKRTADLAGSQVDAIFYCSGVFGLYSHRSAITERINHWSVELESRAGKDSLELIIDFCRRQGREAFWSMRMNDTHDAFEEPHLLSRWKQDHPDCLMGKPGERFPYGGSRWSALNYELPAVRDRVFEILQDVCSRYDVDGVELDFYRHPVYFKPQMHGQEATSDQCAMITDLLHRVRLMTEQVAEKTGKPRLIAVRIPDSVGYCRTIGLDVVRWLREDLIDLLVGSCYNHFEPWENLVALAEPYGVPVYACLSGSRLVDAGDPEREGPIEDWRGEALNAWRAGVAGIYTFNRFNPHDPIFRELGSPERLQKLPHRYTFNLGNLAEMEGWVKNGARFLNAPNYPIEDYISDWLMLGPFPNAGGIGGEGFERDFIQERQIQPEEAMVTAGYDWKRLSDSVVIDFQRARLSPSENAIVYLHTYLFSPEDQTTELLIGSDDGCKAWLNGQLVVNTGDIARSFRQDQDRSPITLQKGRNRLLVKVSQGLGGWMVSVRIKNGRTRGLIYSPVPQVQEQEMERQAGT